MSNPIALPEWQALHREASLVRQIIGSGVTALGRASYGDGFGEYYTAFFGLSVGIERLAKLALIADYAIDHAGSLPGQQIVRRFGHNLTKLCDEADQIAAKHGLALEYSKPTDPICWAALRCLEAFADAGKGRYANFEAIGNPSFDVANEPVNKWWTEVVQPILDKHVSGTRRETKIKGDAQAVDALLGSWSLVLHVNETGQTMTDLQIASERSGQTKWAQKYGRFYTLCVVRWLADIFSELSRAGGYEHQIDALFGHYEFFSSYCVPDSFLLNRKVWPLE